MTAGEFLALGETGERYELIDGVVVMSPTPKPRHQEVLQLIQEQAGAWRRTSPGAMVLPDLTLKLADDLVYEPDLAIYAPGVLKDLTEYPDVPPRLIIEILSPGTKSTDLFTKRDDYQRFGVAEYWVIDPDTLKVRAWRRIGKDFVEQTVEGDTITATSIEGFALDLRELRPA